MDLLVVLKVSISGQWREPTLVNITSPEPEKSNDHAGVLVIIYPSLSSPEFFP